MTLVTAQNLAGDLKTAEALLDSLRVAFTIGAEAADAITVSVQVQGGDDQDVDEDNVALIAWLTDDQGAAEDISTAAPDGGVAVGAAGVIVTELTADLLFLCVTDATGTLEITLTESGVATWYLNVALPGGGVAVSDAITFG